MAWARCTRAKWKKIHANSVNKDRFAGLSAGNRLPRVLRLTGDFLSIQYSRYRLLIRGGLLSLLLHGFALTISSKFLVSTATISQSTGGTKIELRLPLAKQVQTPVAEQLLGLSVPERVPPVHAPFSSLGQKIEEGDSRHAERLLFKPYDQKELRVPVQTIVEATADSAPTPGELLHLSKDGLREYRINLGREARRFKHYPPSAREHGWEGVVVVVVSTTLGLAVPQVRLSRSSGYALLDTQALEMMVQAVGVVNLPESLRGRDFALDLPIHFSLGD